jgi:hypothetical protein
MYEATSWMSFVIIVTRLAWTAQRLAPLKRPDRPCLPPAIWKRNSLTRRWKGNLGIRSPVDFGERLISGVPQYWTCNAPAEGALSPVFVASGFLGGFAQSLGSNPYRELRLLYLSLLAFPQLQDQRCHWRVASACQHSSEPQSHIRNRSLVLGHPKPILSMSALDKRRSKLPLLPPRNSSEVGRVRRFCRAVWSAGSKSTDHGEGAWGGGEGVRK